MKSVLIFMVAMAPLISNATEHVAKFVDGRIVGPTYGEQACASKVLIKTCNEFDAISRLKAEKNSGKFDRVILESKLFSTEKVNGCEGKDSVYYVTGYACE